MQRVLTSGPKFFKVTAYALLVLLMAGIAFSYITSYKWITVYIDGKVYQCATLATNVGEVLEELGLGIGAEDYVTPARESRLDRFSAIAAVRARPYTIVHDGVTTEVLSVGAKVIDVLQDAGMVWQAQDLIIPALQGAAPDNQEITIVRVSIEYRYQTVTLPYATQIVASESLYRGQERLIQSGQDGQQAETLEVVYHDSNLVAQNLISSEQVVAVRDKIIESGAVSSIDRGGLRISISRVLDVQSTAYCPGTEGSGCPVDSRGYSQCTGKATGYTATGRKAKQGAGSRSDPYIIAVDPKVIPLGALCYLTFSGGGITTRHGRIINDGFALAADTGGAIKGNRIDILFDNHWVAWYYGRRSVRVFIVEGIQAK